MPELLPPNQATFVAVPAAARPVAPRQRPAAAPQSPAPADPFRPEPGPPVLLLPHAADRGPERQGRAGGPVRMSRDAFLAAIRANPEDAAPKGAYADWLDERAASPEAEPGDAAVAAIVRHEATAGRRHEWHGLMSGRRTYGRIELPGRIIQFGSHPDEPDAVHVWVGEPARRMARRATGSEYWHATVMSRARARAVADLAEGLRGTVFLGHDRHEASDRPLHDSLDRTEPARPERLAAAQAPAGGLISRGVMYPAGEFLPDLPPGLPAPPAPAPRRPVRERVRKLLAGRRGGRVRQEREGAAVKFSAADDEAFRGAIAASPRDAAPRLVYADYLDETGRPEAAAALRGETARGTATEDEEGWLATVGLVPKNMLALDPGRVPDVLRGNLRDHLVRQFVRRRHETGAANEHEAAGLAGQLEGLVPPFVQDILRRHADQHEKAKRLVGLTAPSEMGDGPAITGGTISPVGSFHVAWAKGRPGTAVLHFRMPGRVSLPQFGSNVVTTPDFAVSGTPAEIGDILAAGVRHFGPEHDYGHRLERMRQDVAAANPERPTARI
jgi:uncharacterized protein (TIGR02996 family)